MPMYDFPYLFEDTTDCFTTTAGTNSTNEINFGVANPNIAAHQDVGIHVVITTAYTDVNSGGDIWVHHGAATAPTTPLCARRLTKTELATAGGHYYIPLPPTNLQYLRLNFDPVSETSSNGELTAWLGPRTGGEA